MKYINTDHWIYLLNESSAISKKEIIGKYLFFSDNKKELINLAKSILKKYNLPSAKVPLSNVRTKSKGFGFVLCVYSNNNNLKSELIQFKTNTISYRHFKTDEDTRNGVYSNIYIETKQ